MTFDDIRSFPDSTGRKCRMPIGARFQDEPLQWVDRLAQLQRAIDFCFEPKALR
jgi:hypothetical protein